jgi:hypothetical protein
MLEMAADRIQRWWRTVICTSRQLIASACYGHWKARSHGQGHNLLFFSKDIQTQLDKNLRGTHLVIYEWVCATEQSIVMCLICSQSKFPENQSFR